jgi:hypothetical protein
MPWKRGTHHFIRDDKHKFMTDSWDDLFFPSPLLRVDLLDKNQAMVEQFNAWHPLWAFVENDDGSESRILLDRAVGQFVFPFSPVNRTMKVVDIPRERELVSIDLAGPIRTFCADNPEDADCPDADGASLSIEAVDPPAEIDVGDQVPIRVREWVVNYGPFGPADFNATFNAVAPRGCDIVATDQITVPVVLDVGVRTAVDATFTIRCSEPSFHTFEFDSMLKPADPNVQDPNAANSTGTTKLTVASIDYADVGLVDWIVSLPQSVAAPDLTPGELVVGERVFFTTTKTLQNQGPFTLRPVDADASTFMDVPPGMEASVHITQQSGERVSVPEGVLYQVIDPAGNEIESGDTGLDRPLGLGHVVKVRGTPGTRELAAHFEVPDLLIGQPVDVRETFDFHCLKPGEYVLGLRTEAMLQPDDPHVRDPYPTNNTADKQTYVTCRADLGDAPDRPYSTRLLSGGAYHGDFTKEWLGASVNGEPDAVFPDLFDDGVLLDPSYRPFRLARVPITISTSGLGAGRYGWEPDRRLYLRGWIDYNKDGDWDDPGELVVDCDVAPGTTGQCNKWPADWPDARQHSQTFVVKFNVGFVTPGWTRARFRLSYGAPVRPTGPAQFGEVEDYRVGVFLQGP